MTEHKDNRTVMVLGASGYIGGRLVPLLLVQGHKVRAAGRSVHKLEERFGAGHDNLDLRAVDVLDPSTLQDALKGCRVVYYLVHSMNPQGGDFAHADRTAAANLVSAATAAGVTRIIYLSGLGDPDDALSEHLSSRAEVADILRGGDVPVTVLRAAMIIGSGSASFEILRYLVESLPVMITPRWLDTSCQPIAVADVLFYLQGCLDAPETRGETFDIGCQEVVTYRQLMEIYAEEAGLPRRLILRVPVLTPRLSSYWIQLVTPIPAALARPLAEGLRNPVLVRDTRIRDIFPQPLFDCRTAIRKALHERSDAPLHPSWDINPIDEPADCQPGDPAWAGGIRFREATEVELVGSGEPVWAILMKIGGDNGWFYADFLWQLRGWLDRLSGGPGMRRGRSEGPLQVGAPLDFWRVAAVEEGQSLLLEAEMKLPGRAALGFHICSAGENRTLLRQESIFLPRGLFGRFYWYVLLPLHKILFVGMLRGICRQAGVTILRGPEPIGKRSKKL